MANVADSSADFSAARAKGGRTLRILYADDVRELRDIAHASLSREGHGVECVADGDLALTRFIHDRDFDLIITDHHMPNMNGLEFVTHLRQLNFAGRIMVFSSELGEAVARQYRALHVDRILYKPVFPSTLRKVLADLFPSPAAAAA